MRNSSILQWAQKNKNNKLNGGSNGSGGGGSGSSNGKSAGGAKDEKKWIHSPETLVSGHVVYLVKFLGSTEVDQPKGIEVVKQGIQKLKFSQQLKKAEQGNDKASTKTPKVELTISVDGVTIQEPKTKRMLHQYPLHKISYCADDKAEKRFFSFIAKEGETQQHTCFVFVSDKLAEEITLTIGQAFELAYKKFLDTSGKELEVKKQIMVLQKRVSLLEGENAELKLRLKDVANIKGQNDVQEYMRLHDITEITEVRVAPTTPSPAPQPSTPATPSSEPNKTAATPATPATPASAASNNNDTSVSSLICLDASTTSAASSNAKLDTFTLDDLNDDDFNPRGNNEDSNEDDDNNAAGGSDDFDPRAPDAPAPTLAPPPPPTPAREAPKVPPPPQGPQQQQQSQQSQLAANMASSENIFGDSPFSSKNPFAGSDPFGMSAFESNVPAVKTSSGGNGGPTPSFQTGVAATGGSAGFSFEDLDPLKK